MAVIIRLATNARVAVAWSLIMRRSGFTVAPARIEGLTIVPRDEDLSWYDVPLTTA